MRIAHIGISGGIIEDMTYQDNLLSKQNALDGHQVLYISNTIRREGAGFSYGGYENKHLPDGRQIIRLPYEHFINRFASEKLRRVKGLYSILNEFSPDVILSHNLSYYSVLDVIRYKKDHPEVKLYADTHAASYNSGTNWLSLHVLHRIYYRYLTQRALPYLEKYFYIGEAERKFSLQNYGVPESLMEFYPLGGVLPSDETYANARQRRRAELGISPDELLLVHSGKFEAEKRTAELLQAFAKVPQLHARLAILGAIPDAENEKLTKLMAEDDRVCFLGWKSADELLEYLCACDLYCQPGGVSATMQNAICCGCPVMSYPHECYTKELNYGNMLWVKTQENMVNTFRRIAEGKTDLKQLSDNSWRCARELLDYRKLAARLYE